jgi:hypothetical protein
MKHCKIETGKAAQDSSLFGLSGRSILYFLSLRQPFDDK